MVEAQFHAEKKGYEIERSSIEGGVDVVPHN